MSRSITNNACHIQIGLTNTTLNGCPIAAAQPVAWFHALLGEPDRIISAGSPAPVGHRNPQIHYYDHLGITLNEHHFTYLVQSVTVVLDTAGAIHPTLRPFSGLLEVGGVVLKSGCVDRVLRDSALPFHSQLKGTWFALARSSTDQEITVAIDTAGRKLASGRRSKVRRVLTVALCLAHDPWETRFRP